MVYFLKNLFAYISYIINGDNLKYFSLIDFIIHFINEKQVSDMENDFVPFLFYFQPMWSLPLLTSLYASPFALCFIIHRVQRHIWKAIQYAFLNPYLGFVTFFRKVFKYTNANKLALIQESVIKTFIHLYKQHTPKLEITKSFFVIYSMTDSLWEWWWWWWYVPTCTNMSMCLTCVNKVQIQTSWRAFKTSTSNNPNDENKGHDSTSHHQLHLQALYPHLPS